MIQIHNQNFATDNIISVHFKTKLFCFKCFYVFIRPTNLERQLLLCHTVAHCIIEIEYQSQNRKGREILPSLSYHSNENNRQRHHFILCQIEAFVLF